MRDEKTVEILKSAILLEKRGRAFYQKVAEQAKAKAVKEFFSMMADEEVKHVQILADQFKAFRQNGQFAPGDFNTGSVSSHVAKVLTRDLKKQISAADYEAAAIAAAMSMEKNAIRLYAERAVEARDPNEKALYEWLAEWERQHLDFLATIDRELTEAIWNDNSFWPF